MIIIYYHIKNIVINALNYNKYLLNLNKVGQNFKNKIGFCIKADEGRDNVREKKGW